MVKKAAKNKDETGFGGMLRVLRKEKHLSQAALGKLCKPEMRYQEIARLESGERGPTWATVLKLAKALGVEPNDFLPEG